jgi:Holliday junction resolvasome RuvABC ATP-dependent DNA helicase subunit
VEEEQIQNFVHRVSQDGTLREELEMHPEEVINREHFTPRVAQIILKLVPFLTVVKDDIDIQKTWWV